LFLFYAALSSTGVWAVEPGPREILRQTVERNQDILEPLSRFRYQRYREVRWLDSQGAVKSADSTLHLVDIRQGMPHSRLVEKNGVVQAKERMDTPDRAEFQKELAERRRAMREIPDAFEWKLAGSEMVEGRGVWVVDASPRAGYQSKSPEAKIFKHTSGRIWIDKEELRMVRIDAHVNDAISFAWFLLRIQPGFRFHFEQTRESYSTWLPRGAVVKGSAKILGIKTVRLEVDTRYRGFEPLPPAQLAAAR